MKNPFKILLLVLLAVVVAVVFYRVCSVAMLYRQNEQMAKRAAQVKSQTRSLERSTIDPKVLEKIDQLDAANVAADVQRFRQDHPEIKNTIQPEPLSAEGITRDFDLALRSADVPALSKLCNKISEDPFSGVTIKTITDNPQICGITRVERPSERDESRSGIPRRMAIYQYEMTDSKQKPFGGTSYLAVSWSKKSGAWALESAITTGSFFQIEKKP